LTTEAYTAAKWPPYHTWCRALSDPPSLSLVDQRDYTRHADTRARQERTHARASTHTHAHLSPLIAVVRGVGGGAVKNHRLPHLPIWSEQDALRMALSRRLLVSGQSSALCLTTQLLWNVNSTHGSVSVSLTGLLCTDYNCDIRPYMSTMNRHLLSLV
jgi:hypothetical protein